ncbi:MAG: hypothetical protein QM703_13610 [Gemmatales bacterium]
MEVTLISGTLSHKLLNELFQVATVADTPIVSDEYESLIAFLTRRQLKERLVDLFKAKIKDLGLKKGQLTSDANATYEKIAECIREAINQGWVSEIELVALFDNAELAGRQHICIFEIDDKANTAIRKTLKNPNSQSTHTKLKDFWDLPDSPYSIVLSNTPANTCVKIVDRRKYWLTEDLDKKYIKDELLTGSPSDDQEFIRRYLHVERAASILFLHSKERYFEVRVPVREKSSYDTGQTVYDYVHDLINSQFGDSGLDWFGKLEAFTICDTYNGIIANKLDFMLLADSPEDAILKATMYSKGAASKKTDIRDLEGWKPFKKGYSRTKIRGVWKIDDTSEVHTHMHYERIKSKQNAEANVCRLFFPAAQTDKEVEHAINRIRSFV